MGAFYNPLLIPIAGMAVAIVAIIAGVVNDIHQKRLKAEQRMAMLQRGMSVSDMERLLGTKDEPNSPRDPLRRLTNTRTAALVLISLGIGAVLFFVVLTVVIHTREILSGAAAGLVPIAIGMGFLVDYRLQAREMVRLGLHVPGSDSPADGIH